MNIYSAGTTDFNNNGLGFLTDTIGASVVDELNGDYELTIEYPIKGHLSEYLVEHNYIKSKVADGTKQLFVITSINKNYNTITVTAKHIFYELLFNMVEDVYPQDLNGTAFLQRILNNTQYPTNFTAYSDISSTATARYVRKNPVECILGAENSMVQKFGGELKRDNYTINFLSRVGADYGLKAMFGKNITGIDININTDETYTRIMPLGYDSLMLPEKYIDSPLIDNYPFPRIGLIKFEDIKYDPEDEDAYHTEEEAYQALRNEVAKLYANGIDRAQISVSIDWLELSKTDQYKNYSNLERVNLGDTIHATILGIDFETRVKRIVYNPLNDRIEEFEIGTIQASLATTMNDMMGQIQEIDPTSILQTAQTNATNLITQAMGGYVYKTNSELYIMDTDDPTTATKVWRWNINGLGYSSTGINGPYGIAMTMDGSIVADFITTGTLNTAVINGYDSLTLQVQANKDDIATIQAEISDIADITTSSSSDTAYIENTELQQIASSNPIRVEIYPISESISYLYPSDTTYPSSITYLKPRTLKFTNTSTNEVFEYELPTDLLYYDSSNYDKFIADFETDKITIIKKCKYNNDGSIGLLETPTTQELSYSQYFAPYFSLTEGNYRVELPGYQYGFIFVRLMVLNAYTAQYATKVELNSTITQTASQINSVVSTKVGNDEVISKINQSSEAITINANKISLDGKNIDLTGDNITISSTNFNVDSNGNMTANSGTFGGEINTSEDCIVGNNLYVGQNQATSYVDNKYIKFSNTSYIQRNLVNGSEVMEIHGDGVGIIADQEFYLGTFDNQNIIIGENFDEYNTGHPFIYLMATSAGQYIDITDTSIEASTNITIASDKRLKDKIKNIDASFIDDLKVKEFEYKKTPGKKQVGLIAQDYIDKDYSKYFLEQNKDGYYGISYGNITNALIQYCQDLKKEVNDLKEEINKLKGGNK